MPGGKEAEMKKQKSNNKPVKKAISESAPPYDVQLMFSVLFLVGIGIVMVYSASSALALKKYGTGYFFLKKQAFFSLLGFMALIICRRIPIKVYRIFAYPFLALALIFLVFVFVPDFGVSAGGSARWLHFGTFSFQPSEFARFALVIYLAYSISKKQDKIREFSVGFLPHVIVLIIFSGLIYFQPDFGSMFILGIITWIMLYAGGVRIVHLLSPLFVLLPALYFLMITAEYRLKRVMSFLDPWQYPADEGYQIIHSLMAFGTGGIWGEGIGKGYQKLFYLPEPHTDFIFSVIGEELGLLGVLIILGLYVLILWRGIIIAISAIDPFGSFLAIGLTTAIGLQVCVNMGVALGLLPTKGLTLPFLSYGGTSLLVNMASIGILMSIRTNSSK